jgi:uncharacterized alpha/beta hydrolase family protein
MKKIFLSVAVAILTTTSLFAQENMGFLQKQVFGKGVPQAPLQLSVDAYPLLFLSKGGGGSVSIEFYHWQISTNV